VAMKAYSAEFKVDAVALYLSDPSRTYASVARDYERHPATSEAIIRWTAISGMVLRFTRGHVAARQQARALALV
jgi:transposase-like protein